MSESIVTPEEFARYVDQFLGTIVCEVCKTQTWSLELDPTIELGPSFALKKQISDGRGMFSSLDRIPICLIACKRCGNTKSFLRSHVEGWLGDNPDG